MLAGSATPALSVQDLIDLSTDSKRTADALSVNSLKLSLSTPSGSEALRRQIAGLYNGITADQVLATQGTSGANALVFQSLLGAGDHIISMYPAYTQLLSIPKAIPGVEHSFWSLDIDNAMQANVQLLESLIQPNTRMIVLNNPNNPLGTVLPLEVQREIAALAHSRGITLLVDEIFRPLFHDSSIGCPPSFVELSDSYENIIVTGSLSKAWGLSGVRTGWIVTRNPDILARCVNLSLYTTMALSTIDQVIATEALSDRCRPAILSRHLDLGRKNIAILSDFVERNQRVCSWTRPSAGGTAFLRFIKDGAPVDDLDFCLKLKEQKGVLLAPGSLCFGLDRAQDFRGFVRTHLTVQPARMASALDALGDFLHTYLNN
jgi:aspartate/methionine/tyrosine aminotransferase